MFMGDIIHETMDITMDSGFSKANIGGGLTNCTFEVIIHTN
jgi:hypothetical protein